MAGRGSRHTQSVVSRHQQGARQYEDAAAGRLEVYETPDSLRSQDICFTEELEGRRNRVWTRVWAERCALREASRLRRTHTPNFCFSAARAPSLVRTSSHRSPSASQRLIHQGLIMMCDHGYSVVVAQGCVLFKQGREVLLVRKHANMQTRTRRYFPLPTCPAMQLWIQKRIQTIFMLSDAARSVRRDTYHRVDARGRNAGIKGASSLLPSRMARVWYLAGCMKSRCQIIPSHQDGQSHMHDPAACPQRHQSSRSSLILTPTWFPHAFPDRCSSPASSV